MKEVYIFMLWAYFNHCSWWIFCFSIIFFYLYTKRKHFSSHVCIKDVIWCVIVWHRWCWWSLESLADQHKREHSQTVPGEHPAQVPQVSPAVFRFCFCPRTLLVSSRLLPVVSVCVCSSITVTLAKSLPALTPADVAVPQQDGSWLCVRGLLLAHRHCRSIHRQQVRVENTRIHSDIMRLES